MGGRSKTTVAVGGFRLGETQTMVSVSWGKITVVVGRRKAMMGATGSQTMAGVYGSLMWWMCV